MKTVFRHMYMDLKKIISVITLTVFIFTITVKETSGLTDTAEKSSAVLPSVFHDACNTTLAHNSFSIPEELGKIKYSYFSGSNRFVIHIQDAHCNYAAQKKIADILSYLEGKYDISSINLEGAQGGYNLSPFQSIKGKDITEFVTDYFLKDGGLNGAEYFAINNPGRSILWGIEEKKLYLKNLDIYRKSQEFAEDTLRKLAKLTGILNFFKSKIYDKALIDMDVASSAYRKNNMDFRDYCNYLLKRSVRNGINFQRYNHLESLFRVMQLEKEIDFKKAELERNKVIRRLEKELSFSETDQLTRKILQFKNKEISRNDFYNYLIDITAKTTLPIKNFPQLEKFLRYISIYDNIDRSRLLTEISKLEQEIKGKLFRSEQQRELDKLSRNLLLITELFSFSLTGNEYRRYKENPGDFSMENYVRFIKEKAPLYNTAIIVDETLTELDQYMRKISAFYEYSFKRDETFLKNIRFSNGTHPQSQNNKDTAIVITGGFHTENLCRMFREKGFSYVSIMPEFRNHEGHINPYFRLLSGKHNHTEKMLYQVAARNSVLGIASRWAPVIGDSVWGDRSGLITEAKIIILEKVARGNYVALKFGNEDEAAAFFGNRNDPRIEVNALDILKEARGRCKQRDITKRLESFMNISLDGNLSIVETWVENLLSAVPEDLSLEEMTEIALRLNLEENVQLMKRLFTESKRKAERILEFKRTIPEDGKRNLYIPGDAFFLSFPERFEGRKPVQVYLSTSLFQLFSRSPEGKSQVDIIAAVHGMINEAKKRMNIPEKSRVPDGKISVFKEHFRDVLQEILRDRKCPGMDKRSIEALNIVAVNMNKYLLNTGVFYPGIGEKGIRFIGSTKTGNLSLLMETFIRLILEKKFGTVEIAKSKVDSMIFYSDLPDGFDMDRGLKNERLSENLYFPLELNEDHPFDTQGLPVFKETGNKLYFIFEILALRDNLRELMEFREDDITGSISGDAQKNIRFSDTSGRADFQKSAAGALTKLKFMIRSAGVTAVFLMTMSFFPLRAMAMSSADILTGKSSVFVPGISFGAIITVVILTGFISYGLFTRRENIFIKLSSLLSMAGTLKSPLQRDYLAAGGSPEIAMVFIYLDEITGKYGIKVDRNKQLAEDDPRISEIVVETFFSFWLPYTSEGINQGLNLPVRGNLTEIFTEHLMILLENNLVDNEMFEKLEKLSIDLTGLAPGEYLNAYSVTGNIARGLDNEETGEDGLTEEKRWRKRSTIKEKDVSDRIKNIVRENALKLLSGRYLENMKRTLRDTLSEDEVNKVVNSLKNLAGIAPEENSEFFDTGWMNARVSSADKYLLGTESSLAVQIIEYLNNIEGNEYFETRERRDLVAEYILHEVLENIFEHYEIIRMTSDIFQRDNVIIESAAGGKITVDTPLGRMLSRFISFSANKISAGKKEIEAGTARGKELFEKKERFKGIVFEENSDEFRMLLAALLYSKGSERTFRLVLRTDGSVWDDTQTSEILYKVFDGNRKDIISWVDRYLEQTAPSEIREHLEKVKETAKKEFKKDFGAVMQSILSRISTDSSEKKSPVNGLSNNRIVFNGDTDEFKLLLATFFYGQYSRNTFKDILRVSGPIWGEQALMNKLSRYFLIVRKDDLVRFANMYAEKHDTLEELLNRVLKAAAGDGITGYEEAARAILEVFGKKVPESPESDLTDTEKGLIVPQEGHSEESAKMPSRLLAELMGKQKVPLFSQREKDINALAQKIKAEHAVDSNTELSALFKKVLGDIHNDNIVLVAGTEETEWDRKTMEKLLFFLRESLKIINEIPEGILEGTGYEFPFTIEQLEPHTVGQVGEGLKISVSSKYVLEGTAEIEVGPEGVTDTKILKELIIHELAGHAMTFINKKNGELLLPPEIWSEVAGLVLGDRFRQVFADKKFLKKNINQVKKTGKMANPFFAWVSESIAYSVALNNDDAFRYTRGKSDRIREIIAKTLFVDKLGRRWVFNEQNNHEWSLFEKRAYKKEKGPQPSQEQIQQKVAERLKRAIEEKRPREFLIEYLRLSDYAFKVPFPPPAMAKSVLGANKGLMLMDNFWTVICQKLGEALNVRMDTDAEIIRKISEQWITGIEPVRKRILQDKKKRPKRILGRIFGGVLGGFIGKVRDAEGNIIENGITAEEKKGRLIVKDLYGREVADIPLVSDLKEPEDISSNEFMSNIASILDREIDAPEVFKKVLNSLREKIENAGIQKVVPIEHAPDNPDIKGLFANGTLYINEYLYDNPLALLHETGEAYADLPAGERYSGLNRHTFMRGAGKDLRNAFNELVDEKVLDFSMPVDPERFIRFLEKKLEEMEKKGSISSDRVNMREQGRQTGLITASEVALIRLNADSGLPSAQFLNGLQDFMDPAGNMAFTREIRELSDDFRRGTLNIFLIPYGNIESRQAQEKMSRKTARNYRKKGMGTLVLHYGPDSPIEEQLEKITGILFDKKNKDKVPKIFVNVMNDRDKKAVYEYIDRKGLTEEKKRALEKMFVTGRDSLPPEAGSVSDIMVDDVKIIAIGSAILNDNRLRMDFGFTPEQLYENRLQMLRAFRNSGIIDSSSLKDTSAAALEDIMQKIYRGDDDIIMRITPVKWENVRDYHDSMQSVLRSL